MYSVSPEFITALHAEARFERVRGSIDNISFDDSNVLSLGYSNRCSDTADISFGSCYLGELQATFIDISISRGDWRGKVITLEWGLVLEDESIEYIPVGVFTIQEATWSASGISVKAYDNTSKLDKICLNLQTTGTVYDLLSLACLECGLELGQTELQIAALPNGNKFIASYPNSDIKTWRDYVSWVAQVVGGFAYCGRDGKLYVKSFYNLSAVDSFTDEERDISTTFSDYTTLYDGISVVDIESQELIYFSAGTGGAVINLGSNPFLQYGKEEREELLNTLANVAASLMYTPFNSTILSSIVYDLGDVITCSGGIAGSSTLSCCVMSIDWNSKHSTNLQGFGSDPNLTSGKSKTDKALNGLMRKTSENEVIIHTFKNSQSFTLGNEEEVEILSLRFATISPKIINLWHEIELKVEAIDDTEPIVCVARYYLNDDLITYTPITSWDNDGFHLLHLLYFLSELEGNTLYSWKVTLELLNATATIDIDNIHASLYGQGLVASDQWDGVIDASDVISAHFGGSFTVTALTESVTLEEREIESINATDVVTAHFGGSFEVTLSESVSVLADNILFDIHSADYEEQIVSSDGLYFLRSSQ